jgi:hypothetical protein
LQAGLGLICSGCVDNQVVDRDAWRLLKPDADDVPGVAELRRGVSGQQRSELERPDSPLQRYAPAPGRVRTRCRAVRNGDLGIGCLGRAFSARCGRLIHRYHPLPSDLWPQWWQPRVLDPQRGSAMPGDQGSCNACEAVPIV